jgi:hypothetical protein
MEVQNLNALIEAMAITEYNLHGYDPDKYDDKKSKGMDKKDQ